MKFWLGLQDDYDVEEELLKKAKEIKTTKQYLMKKKIYIFSPFLYFFQLLLLLDVKKQQVQIIRTVKSYIRGTVI